MNIKANSQNFRVISDDNRTVKMGYQSIMTFRIVDHQNADLLHIGLASQSTVADLLKLIKQKLSIKKFPIQRIICLESSNNQEVLDYALLLDDYEVSNFHNNECFRLVLFEEVRSDQWISLSDFSFKKCLGQGASANVSLVRHKGNGKLYALKQIEKNYFVEFKRMEQVLRQQKIMTEIINDFPFCAKLYASFQSEKHLNFLLEFYPGGQMFFHLHSRRLSQSQAKLYFAEMTLTFEFLHNQKVIYRDLKPQNIMIDFYGHARLTDFGLCKINLGKQDLTTSYCGSIQYMAPQVKQNAGYNYSVDFYTLGAFLYEMVMGVPPYYNSHILHFSETSSSSYRNLVKGLIQNDVQMRIKSFKQIKNSKWMSDVIWSQVNFRAMKMPFNVSPYETYIHDQFKSVSVEELNSKHQEKYDRLFGFFTFFRNDRQNSSLRKFYQKSSLVKTVTDSKRSTSGMSKDLSSSSKKIKDAMKKKFVRDRSIRENSRSKDPKSKIKSGEKSKNSSKKKQKFLQTNIYLKKTGDEHKNERSKSPNQITFKKSINLKTVKSNKDLIKQALYKI